MSDPSQRIYYVGPIQWPGTVGAPELGEQLERVFGAKVRTSLPDFDELTSADIVVLSVVVEPELAVQWSGGSALTLCRQLKVDAKPQVYLLVPHGPRHIAEVARFCLADGVLAVDDRGSLRGLDDLPIESRARRPRVSTEELLESLEREPADESRRESAVERMLAGEKESWVERTLTDPETGLFSADFAGFKLDEEFKRAQRFHQPLTLVLVDLGAEDLPADGPVRRGALAEVSSVFLNECRDIDVLARFTETVFLCLLPGTGGAGAEIMTRRILDSLVDRSPAGIELAPAAALATVPDPAVRDRAALLGLVERRLDTARCAEGAERLQAANSE